MAKTKRIHSSVANLAILLTLLGCLPKQIGASIMLSAASASDLAGGQLVTFEAPTVTSNPYMPSAGGVTFSSDDTSIGLFSSAGGTALGFEGDLAPLSISFDSPVIATHWVQFGVFLPDQVELFSDNAFTNSLGVADISSFATSGGGQPENGFFSDTAFLSMRLLGSSSANIDDFRFTAVPEPSAMLMMILVSATIGLLKVRQRHKHLLADA